eukprot:1848767-Pleurochrysis_carterae.AAC.1
MDEVVASAGEGAEAFAQYRGSWRGTKWKPSREGRTRSCRGSQAPAPPFSEPPRRPRAVNSEAPSIHQHSDSPAFTFSNGLRALFPQVERAVENI